MSAIATTGTTTATAIVPVGVSPPVDPVDALEIFKAAAPDEVEELAEDVELDTTESVGGVGRLESTDVIVTTTGTLLGAVCVITCTDVNKTADETGVTEGGGIVDTGVVTGTGIDVGAVGLGGVSVEKEVVVSKTVDGAVGVVLVTGRGVVEGVEVVKITTLVS